MESLEATNIECSLLNIATSMVTLHEMVHNRVHLSQFTEKEQNCVKLANPPKCNNAVSPDPEQPSVSKSIEIATSYEVINAESLSELLQLSVDDEMLLGNFHLLR